MNQIKSCVTIRAHQTNKTKGFERLYCTIPCTKLITRGGWYDYYLSKRHRGLAGCTESAEPCFSKYCNIFSPSCSVAIFLRNFFKTSVDSQRLITQYRTRVPSGRVRFNINKWVELNRNCQQLAFSGTTGESMHVAKGRYSVQYCSRVSRRKGRRQPPLVLWNLLPTSTPKPSRALTDSSCIPPPSIRNVTHLLSLPKFTFITSSISWKDQYYQLI